MALIICPECGKEISDQASQCIHCGCPIHPKENRNTRCTIDGTEFDFSEMLDIYHNRGRIQSVRSFNEVMEKIEKALGRDKDKQLRVYLLNYITDQGQVPQAITRSQIPPQDPKDALNIGDRWLEMDVSGPLRCPKCGSQDIGKLEGGRSVLWNFLGTGIPKNVCRKCGHKFRP